MCKRTASWGYTAGLRYATPRETLDQMVLLDFGEKTLQYFCEVSFLIYDCRDFFEIVASSKASELVEQFVVSGGCRQLLTAPGSKSSEKSRYSK